MNQTGHYQFSQWDAFDKLRRTDLNNVISAIDNLLAQKTELVYGTYIGTGLATQHIDLGFQPKLVLTTSESGTMGTNGSYCAGGMALPGVPVEMTYSQEVYTALEVSGSGFTAHEQTDGYSYIRANTQGGIYRYLAVKAG